MNNGEDFKFQILNLKFKISAVACVHSRINSDRYFFFVGFAFGGAAARNSTEPMRRLAPDLNASLAFLRSSSAFEASAGGVPLGSSTGTLAATPPAEGPPPATAAS